MLRSKKGVKIAVWILLSVLIADVCRGIGSLEIGQRVVRYARSRTAEQSNIDGVGGRSPGIARKLHQRPVDDKSPCLKNGIEQYIPLRTGVKIGCLAHTEDQIVFDRNVLHTPLRHNPAVGHPRRRVARLLRSENRIAFDQHSVPADLNPLVGIRRVRRHRQPAERDVGGCDQKRNECRFQGQHRTATAFERDARLVQIELRRQRIISAQKINCSVFGYKIKPFDYRTERICQGSVPADRAASDKYGKGIGFEGSRRARRTRCTGCARRSLRFGRSRAARYRPRQRFFFFRPTPERRFAQSSHHNPLFPLYAAECRHRLQMSEVMLY